MLRKIFVALVILSVLVTIFVMIVRFARQVGVNQGYAPDQPIAYSHKIHAGRNKIPCLYCHFGAEKGRHAGIPPASLCMNCHKKIKADSSEIGKIKEALEQNRPIEWVKVHRLPDFAYFNHSQHVVGRVGTSPPQAGVEGEAPSRRFQGGMEGATRVPCNDCHGPVETMTRMRQEKPLTMGWCIGCHRSRGIVPPEEHPQKKLEEGKGSGGTDCSKCHY